MVVLTSERSTMIREGMHLKRDEDWKDGYDRWRKNLIIGCWALILISDLEWQRCFGGKLNASTSGRNGFLDRGSEVSNSNCR